jgi:predicted negative regulator of RcsB-dependent stress response
MSENSILTFLFFLILVLVGWLGWAMVEASQTANERMAICRLNGYADSIDLSGQNYCYILKDNAGQLVLVDSLIEEPE